MKYDVDFQEPDRAFVRAKVAAYQLGVDYEVIQGQVEGGNLPGFRSTRTKTGRPTWFVYKDAIRTLQTRMRTA